VYGVFFFGVVPEFELRALCLLGRGSTISSYISSPFCSGYFGDGGGSHVFAQACLDCDPPIYASCHS
jgi:hypothetical protein